MTSQARPIHVPAGAAINESTRAEWVEFGTASLTNENVRQGQRQELRKRDGFSEPLSLERFNGTSSAFAYKVFADGDQTLRITNVGGLYQLEGWDSLTGSWIPHRGYLPECTYRSIELPGMGAISALCDCAVTTTGYVGMTWLSRIASVGFYTFGAVINPTTGVIVSPPTQVGTLSSTSTDQDPLMVGVGPYLIALRRETGTGNVKAYTLDTTDATTIAAGWVSMGNLVTDLGAPNRFAVCSLPHGTDPKAAIVYTNNLGGTDQVSLAVFDETGVLDSTTIGTSSTAAGHVDVAGTADGTLWVAWNETTSVKVEGHDPNSLASVSSSVATVITTTGNATHVGIVDSPASGEGKVLATAGTSPVITYHRAWTTSAGAVTPSTSTSTVYGLGVAASPFEYGGRYYVAVYSAGEALASGTLTSVVLVDWTDDGSSFRPVANPYPGLAANPYTVKRHAITVGDKIYHPWPVARSAGGDGGVLVELDFASSARWIGARIGSTIHLGGGVTYYTDGARVAEDGFLFSPPKPSTSLAGTGLTGDYRYVAVYEEIDAEGNWHQSGLSAPSAVATAADDTITVTTYPLVVSGRINPASTQASSLRVAFYRTAEGGEPPYYRLATVANSTSGVVTYADAIADATLIANAKLYSQPGVLGTAQDHRPPPGFVHVIDHLGLVVGMTEREIWSSGQPVYGEGTWFSPVFSTPFSGGTALASQDGLVYAFTRRAVYAVPCEPPSDNGAQGGMGAPQLLAADVGCIEPRSVVVTSLGVFFQSERGIELLTRGRNVEWAGEPVAVTLRSFPIIVSAKLDPLDSLVYFECVEAEAGGRVDGDGCTLVFDLTLQSWVSRDRRKDAAGTADAPAQDAAIVRSGLNQYRYAWLGSDGALYIQDRTTSLDAGAWVGATWETADAKFGLQQRQVSYGAMVQLERLSAAGLTIECAYDGGGYEDVHLWDEADTNEIQLEFRPKTTNQRVRFRVSDVEPAVLGTGRGFAWIGLSLDFGMQQSMTRNLPNVAVGGRR